jgi:hypothetical protein
MPDRDHTSDSEWLAWLADAPMFIDAQQVGGFYDAVVGPAFRTVELQISKNRAQQSDKSVDVSLSATLRTLFPWLQLDASTTARRAATASQQEGESIILQPVESATRQLVKLSLHYRVNQADRISFVGPGSPLPGEDAISASPRMIAFIDAAAGTQFLPLAAELNDGRVVTFFDPLIEKLQRDGGTLPVRYPDNVLTEEGRRDKDSYWTWFCDHWNAVKTVRVAEDVIGAGGRPRWIDYRATLGTGETLDLHVAGRGEFDTGVFAYNLIKRGWRRGLRIVGSLKSKPALNVLAIYEK